MTLNTLDEYGRTSSDHAEFHNCQHLLPYQIIKIVTVDMQLRNFLKSRVWRQFQREVPCFWRYPNYLLTQCRISQGLPLCQKWTRTDQPFQCNSGVLRRDRHWAIANTVLPQGHAVKMIKFTHCIKHKKFNLRHIPRSKRVVWKFYGFNWIQIDKFMWKLEW